MRSYVIDLKGKQFGRHAEVAIKNFVTGKEYLIDNRYDITFEFFKTIDEADNNSTGKVSIRGISKESFKEINSEGGEIKLTCGYTNTEIKTLFIANIVSMSLKFEEGQNVLEIDCSANMMNYYLHSYVETPYEELSPLELIQKFANLANGYMSVDLLALPTEHHPAAQEFFKTASFKVDYYGSPKTMLSELASLFGMDVTAVPNEGNEVAYPVTYKFVLKTSGVKELLRMINEGYPKINRSPEETKKKADNNTFLSVFLTPEEEYKKAWYLSYKTGLISYQDEFKVVNALGSKELAANETETIKSQQKGAEQAEKDKKKALEVAQKRAAGKKVKDYKPKVRHKQVTRQFVKVRALLNPSVRPQAHVMVVDDGDFRIFRVRDVTFKGSNQQGDWIMELSCEDSDGRYDRAPTQAELAAMNQNFSSSDISEGEMSSGQFTNDTSYGGY